MFDAPGIARLERLGLVKRYGVEGGGFDDLRLTNMGKEYFNDNPRLKNPINWGMVIQAAIAVGAMITAIAAIFARSKFILFRVTCKTLCLDSLVPMSANAACMYCECGQDYDNCVEDASCFEEAFCA